MTADEPRLTEAVLVAERSAKRYGAFVSYRHTDPDRQWAKWLHSTLETFRVPRQLVLVGTSRRIGRVFRDEEERPPPTT